MAEPARIVTAPVRGPDHPGFASLASVVAADALVRQAWSAGRPADLTVPVLAGELQSHHALERELARQGRDGRSLTDAEYGARSAAFAADCLEAVTARLAALGVGGSLVHLAAGEADVVRVAHTAFVTLYEQGLVELVDRVVPTCPRCRTALDDADTVPGEVAGERLTVALAVEGGGDLHVALDDPELLVGAVAVAVPEGHAGPGSGSGSGVTLPLADRTVPVVVDPTRTEPGLVVAAHDPRGHALAVAAGLAAIPVLDGDGVVCAPGPLAGLGRFAARAEARALLEAEGAVVSAVPVTEQVSRCGSCATVVVPQLGRHWVLRSGDLEVAAADAVRAGEVAFSPPEARDAFLARAGARREWCLSSGVPGGVAVPAAVCLDCGRLAVQASPVSSCNGCMGQLAPDRATLDARFVAAAWALGLAGWPDRRGAAPAPPAVVSTLDDLGRWVVPAMALGLRLAGSPLFGQVTVHPWPRGDEPPAPDAFGPGVDRRVARLALVAGTGDLAAADAAVAALDGPAGPGGPGPDEVMAEVAASLAAALSAGTPTMAAGLLVSSLVAGVPAAAAGRLRALASPILGE
ncbi:MAG TPA: class I tRNA ligase family protein [Acidimicrobiales bacterium]|nr:class I tRNA ligase family protein [Acidimicrobiales bacterium]